MKKKIFSLDFSFVLVQRCAFVVVRVLLVFVFAIVFVFL